MELSCPIKHQNHKHGFNLWSYGPQCSDIVVWTGFENLHLGIYIVTQEVHGQPAPVPVAKCVAVCAACGLCLNRDVQMSRASNVTWRLDQLWKNIQTKPELAQVYAHQTVCTEKAPDKKLKWECPVCFGEVNTALQCGHGLCSPCSDSVELCPVCKTEIKQRIKLFVG